MGRGAGANSGFGRLWVATAGSAVGTGLTTAAVPLAAAARPGSEVTLGLVAAAALLPGALLAVPAGLLVDRVDRVRAMVVADLLRALVVGAAAIALVFGSLPPLALMALAFAVGCGETVFVTASQSAVPALVAPSELDHANGRLQAATDAGREFVGPPLGSLAFRAVSWLPFAGDAATYLLSAAVLTGVRSPAAEPPAEHAAAATGIAPAWQLLRRNRTLLALALGLVALSLCGAAVLAQLVLLVTDQWELDQGWFGLALTLVACGATLAGVFAGHVRARLSARVVLPAAVALNATAYLVLGAGGALVAIPALVLWGAAVTMGNITSVGLRQRLVPAHLLGRVMGLFRAGLGIGGVVGAALGGLLARHTGPDTVAIVAGLAQLPVAAMLAAALPSTDAIPGATGVPRPPAGAAGDTD